MAKITCNMISYTLKRTVDLTIVVPTVTIPGSMGPAESLKYQGKPKYPVLYLFHGMGNNHAQWTGYTKLELYAEERNMVVVMISAENKSYVNLGGDRYYDFIENELQDFIKGTFPVSTRPEDTYVAGLSMGGYGTYVHALRNPEKYAAAGCLSPAVKFNPYSLSRGEVGAIGFNDDEVEPEIRPYDIADKAIAEGKKLPPFYICAGGNETGLIELNKVMYDKLKAAGVKVEWDVIEGYGHEWRFWDIEIEKFLDWIPRTDVYAAEGKRRI